MTRWSLVTAKYRICAVCRIASWIMGWTFLASTIHSSDARVPEGEVLFVSRWMSLRKSHIQRYPRERDLVI
jgi:hypothetical protein